MNKLTIEDIMPYIPFGLKVKVKEKSEEIWTVEGKNIDGFIEMSLDENTTAMANITIGRNFLTVPPVVSAGLNVV